MILPLAFFSMFQNRIFFYLKNHYTIAINCIKKVICQNKNKTMQQLTYKISQPFPQILGKSGADKTSRPLAIFS